MRTPPGPKGTWIGGNLAEFRDDRLGFFQRCAREFGDTVSMRFGPRRVYLLSNPTDIESVLVTLSRSFIKHFALRLNPLVLGQGLLTSEGDFWLRQRRLIQPAFLPARIASYADYMIEATDSMLDTWKPGLPIDIFESMMQLTLDIAAKTLFDADVKGDAGEVGHAMNVLQESFLARFNSLIPIPSFIPIPRNLRLRRAVRQLDQILYRFIQERRQSHEPERNDLLSLLLHARDEHAREGMTDRQLRDEAMTLFLAGHETTALSLSWSWYLLATNPDASRKLHSEVDEVIGDRVPTADDVERLPLCEAIVKEAMRLFPPAYVVGREAIEECAVGEYTIPRKTTVMMSQWVVQRDPRYFDEPEEFRPERWLTESDRPKFAYFPFGGGPRTCIGNAFAMLESVLILARIAQSWNFTLEPSPPVEAVPVFTLRPKHGIPARLDKR